MKFISIKYAAYMAIMPDLPHLIGPRLIILSGLIASNMGDAECTEKPAAGQNRTKRQGRFEIRFTPNSRPYVRSGSVCR